MRKYRTERHIDDFVKENVALYNFFMSNCFELIDHEVEKFTREMACVISELYILTGFKDGLFYIEPIVIKKNKTDIVKVEINREPQVQQLFQYGSKLRAVFLALIPKNHPIEIIKLISMNLFEQFLQICFCMKKESVNIKFF